MKMRTPEVGTGVSLGIYFTDLSYWGREAGDGWYCIYLGCLRILLSWYSKEEVVK